MREPRIYQPMPLIVGARIELDEQGSRHIGTVLRADAGQPLRIFNGDGNEYRAQVVISSRKKVEVEVLEQVAISRASSLRTHLGQCISRGDRMDYALQKAVELGVTEITPLFSQRGEVRLHGPRLEKRLQQWQRLIESACEQCGLNQLPVLHPAQPFDAWCSELNAPLRLILHPFVPATTLPPSDQPPATVAVAIGPEGGFAESEVEQAIACRFQGMSLGPRILRTETAPSVCLSLLQGRWGDITFG